MRMRHDLHSGEHTLLLPEPVDLSDFGQTISRRSYCSRRPAPKAPSRKSAISSRLSRIKAEPLCRVQ